MNKKEFKEWKNKLREATMVYEMLDLQNGYIRRDIERQKKYIAKGILSEDEELMFYDFYYEFRNGLVLEREYVAREILLKFIYNKYGIKPEIHYFGVHAEHNYNCVDIVISIIKAAKKKFNTLKEIMPDKIDDKDFFTDQVTKMYNENIENNEWYLGVDIKDFVDSVVRKDLGIELKYTIGDKVIYNISNKKRFKEVVL